MNEQNLCELTLASTAELIRSGSTTPTEVIEVTLGRIQRINDKVNAYVTLLKDEALKKAKLAEKEIKAGRYKGFLHGIPIGIKDIIDIKGVRTTAGSKILVDNIADHDATVVNRLNKAGAIMVGKLNTHEFALGVTTDSALFGITRNPWDTSRIVGGSSGGPAAAVASSICLASLGTDGGGSIRIPAALCGVVGFKPTFGRVSRYGVLPVHWSLEHVGIITKTIEDVAITLNVVAGRDPRDPGSSSRRVPDYTKALSVDLDGAKIGYISEHTGESVAEEVDSSFKAALKIFEKLGATVEEVSLPWVKYGNLAKSVIIAAEAASLLWDRVKDRASEMEIGTRKYLASGILLSALDYIRAQQLRMELARRVKDVFRIYDLLLNPTCPATAPKIRQMSYVVGRRREKDLRDLITRFCSIYNMPGFPAISVPCGFDSEGLPIGLQIAGRAFEDEFVLKAGYAYQAYTEWHRKSPAI